MPTDVLDIDDLICVVDKSSLAIRDVIDTTWYTDTPSLPV